MSQTSTPPAEPASAGSRGIEERIDLHGRTLRQHAARGTVINSAFQVGLASLGLVRRVVIAAFLTRTEFGIWGILITTFMTLSWLKEIGIADKYIQQSERDQELAFQKAFTLELLLSLAFFVVMAAGLPLFALAYGRWDIVLPGLVLAASVPISALESPIWIAYRRMQFVRQRTLASIDPVVTTLATIALGVAGAGYWSLVVGVLIGSVAGAGAAVATCPYPLRLRFRRETAREYASFSWPLFGYQLTNLVMLQGLLIVSTRVVGVAGVGVIGLAGEVSAFADRVDRIVSQSIYPAVCAVADRTELLFEAFVKSNRLALMWGMPFGVGVCLFARDLIDFVLGSQWRPAVAIVAALGLVAAFRQVAFNWQIFMRAVGRTRPMFVIALVNAAVIAIIVVPCVIAFGLTGYAIGMAAATAVELVGRTYFLQRLFSGFSMTRQLLRATLPCVPGAAAVLLFRLVFGTEDTLAAALGLLALFVVLTVVATWSLERSLMKEIAGYLTGGGGLRARARVA
jgi:polysaccharide transporter, PST family